jgi:hypothetical protein
MRIGIADGIADRSHRRRRDRLIGEVVAPALGCGRGVRRRRD